MTVGDDSRTRRRQTAHLLAAGLLLALAAVAVAVVVSGLFRGTSVGVPLGIALALCAVVTAVGLLTPRLRRASEQVLIACSVAAGLTGLVLVTVLVGVLVLGRVPLGAERTMLAPAFLSVALAALLSAPVADAIRSGFRRGLRPRSRTPQEVLDTVSRSADGSRAAHGTDGPGPGSGTGEDDELFRQLAEALSRSLSARQVEIWTESPSGLSRVLALPARSLPTDSLPPTAVDALQRTDVAGAAWLRLWLPELVTGRHPEIRLAPVTHARAVLGLVVVERSADDPPFSHADERVLAEVANRLGVVLHSRELDSALQATLLDLQRTNDELRASRARLVATADRERRRLERDLHDGAQQHLVALAVNLGLARQLIDDDPLAARELLDESADAVRETVQQLRDLAHGIYPPLLMDAGLGEAVRAASTRSPLAVDVRVDGVGRHAAAIEAAVYFCCLEALQNAAKHAPGSSVTVRLVEHHGDDGPPLLSFEVSDNGPGLGGGGATGGQGLQNMADRLGAVGGSVSWDDNPGGGARVRGLVPLPLEPDVALAAGSSPADAGT